MQTSKHQQQKTTQPTFGSLFAGVGGFDLGFEAARYTCGFQVEWDKHCQQVLAHHWPNVPRWEDVSDVNGADLPPVDVITYGFPCQDLSVAGKRAGLDGNRSHLFFEAVRIITEMREATNGRYPTWAVAENVAGLLNADRGHAMARVLDELAEAGSLVIEWATLDAQWFGVPQRRRRVFITSCFDPATAERCPNPLLPVSTSRIRNLTKSEEKRQDIAESVATGVAFGASSFGGFSEDIGCLRATNARESMLVADTLPIAFSHTQGLDPQPSTDNFPTLRSEGAGHAIAQPHFAVRRLTPTECERLMGWPDNHTLHRADGKTNPDSTRYKMCGNGVAAPVAKWIAKHLAHTLTQ